MRVVGGLDPQAGVEGSYRDNSFNKIDLRKVCLKAVFTKPTILVITLV